MYKIPASTVFMGKSLIYRPQCHSTNVVAAELAQKDETAEGTLVITDHQTHGKGQRGNVWNAQPGQNLTFSLILRPVFLAPRDQFMLNESISLGIADYVKQKVKDSVRIKWPNDIMVDDKKVCGILIENHIIGEQLSYAIAGIGLNINQRFFAWPRAASLKTFSGVEYQLEDELTELVGTLESRYLSLKAGAQHALSQDYQRLLYQLGKTSRYRAGEVEFEGVITGVNEAGQLTMKVGEAEKIYNVRELQFL